MQNSGSNRDTPVHFAPLSLVRGGWYYHNGGSVLNRGGGADYRESKAHPTAAYAYVLDISSTALNPQHYSVKGNGFSIRCTIR